MSTGSVITTQCFKMASQSNSSKNSFVNLKIVSFNARGLRSNKKRRTLFYLFKKNKYDIICLQESHLLKSDSYLIQREWASKFHLAEGSKNSKGLLTLFSKSLADVSISIVKENERCLISEVISDDMNFKIVNVYAPCLDGVKVRFLDSVTDFVKDVQSGQDDNFIILGDFNTVLNNKLDIISGEPHADLIVNRFKHFVNDLLVKDIWRYLHGNKKEFTWSRNRPFIARRLDFIFTSDHLLPFCKESAIKEIGFSDHKAVYLNIDFSTFERGSSFYKFNVSLLHDQKLVDEIAIEIERIKKLDLDPHLKWEYIKASIRDLGKMYGRLKACKKRRDVKILTSELEELNKHLSHFPDDKEAIKMYGDLKNKLEIINIKEADGARIRAGQKWAQEGERCTKYFLNLEKQRSNSNTIYSLVDGSGDQIHDPAAILECIKSHFEDVYMEDKFISKEGSGDLFFADGEGDVLDDCDKSILNVELSVLELSNALKKSNNNSAPGSDGLPCEIYKFFWKNIQDPLLDCFNYSLETGHLCQSQTMGVICLHHKGKGLPREIISNWRPISLTNFDYKLLAKSMALRLNSCLFKCVHEDQYAFMKGRQVSDLLREIDNILQLGKTKFPDSIILSLDYAKAFDTISLKAVKKALLYFGFDGKFVSWIDLLLKDRKSCVQNGGYLSDYFEMERGVRQGCPISPLLFIITLELLARHIRKDEHIKGLKFSERITKIKLYADDATLFLRDMIDYREVLSRIKSFSCFSGLCLNKQKSAAMMIGATDFKNKIKFGIKFVNRLKILGITFSNECCADEISENYDSKIEQLEKLCSLWGKRYLTIIGRITIIKTFGISLFIYLMQSIGIGVENLKKINTIIHRFIWNPHASRDKKVTEKIKREIVSKSYEQGGMNMIDLVKLQDSFLLKWADRFLSSSRDSWKDTASIFFEKVGGISAFRSDLVSADFKGLNLINNMFWKKVLTTWLNYKNNATIKTFSAPSILEPIFNNSRVKFKNQVLFNSKCIRLRLLYISDFLYRGEIISFNQFNIFFENSADSLLVYNSIYNALSRYNNHFKTEYENRSHALSYRDTFRDMEAGKIDRKILYNIIRCSKIEPIKELWLERFPLDKDDSRVWSIARNNCSETKIIELQWKILHAIYPSGVLLHKMKIKNSETCEFCGERDTLPHFFVTCSVAKAAWDEADKLLSGILGRKCVLSEKNKILGILDDDNLFQKESAKKVNEIILVCKRSISKFKYEKAGDIRLLFENQLLFRGLLDQ